MSKLWGKSEFWGLGPEFDADWKFNEKQLKLRDQLIQLCKTKIRPMAVQCDATYEYPRESLKALSSLGLMGLIIPQKFGGLGENHVCAMMVLETLARYGCPSTAMIYAMHIQAVSILLFRHHCNEEIQKLLRKINPETLVGTSSYSDPATGGHFWFPLTAKAKQVDADHFRVFRFNSWTTGAGFADFYVFQTPTSSGIADHSDLTGFYVYKDEVRASSDEWYALGLHGNQSGPLIFDGVLHRSRMLGKQGDGRKSNDEVGAVFFLLCTTSVWNGLAMGCIDLARKHTRQKTHGDLGMRVCDYPAVQDHVGRSVCSTNCCRSQLLLLATQMDNVSSANDWERHQDEDFMPRSAFTLWLMQAKHNASENVSAVADLMMKACGGDGYKSELGLERLLRDAKAGCLMAPTNEVIRGLMGKGALIGLDALDMWDKMSNEKLVYHEINKMSLSDKKDLLKSLAEDVQREEGSSPYKHPNQETDFENPFNTENPKSEKIYTDEDKVEHRPGLLQEKWTPLRLVSRNDVNLSICCYLFALPQSTDHSGCLSGQFVQLRIEGEGKSHERYFSPTSPPNKFGFLEIMLKFETHGVVSNLFKTLKTGSTVDCRGPCGGFEYEQNAFCSITVIASGAGVTPGVQLIRSVAQNPQDKTKITLIHSINHLDYSLYKDELERIAEKDDRINFVMTMTEPPEDWQQETGFVEIELLKKHLPVTNGATHKVLLCGGASMTISCLHSLRLLKVPSDAIFIYGQFGAEQIRRVYGRHAKLSTHNKD